MASLLLIAVIAFVGDENEEGKEQSNNDVVLGEKKEREKKSKSKWDS